MSCVVYVLVCVGVCGVYGYVFRSSKRVVRAISYADGGWWWRRLCGRELGWAGVYPSGGGGWTG